MFFRLLPLLQRGCPLQRSTKSWGPKWRQPRSITIASVSLRSNHYFDWLPRRAQLSYFTLLSSSSAFGKGREKCRNCTIVSLLWWKAKYDGQLLWFVNGIAVGLYGLQAIEPGRLKQLQQSVSTASSYRFRVECLDWSFAVCCWSFSRLDDGEEKAQYCVEATCF